ncbi:MAG: 6-hydroxyaminopurine reductase [Enterobacteriaceae bacterium]
MYYANIYIGAVRTRADGFTSAIDKKQVSGELILTPLGLEGDQQAEQKVHGGPDRALCHYPREHYQYWCSLYPESDSQLAAPAMGENISTEGLTEEEVYIGDMFSWGEALIQVTQPRSPCYKVSLSLDKTDFASQMQESGRCGWLYRVIQPGRVFADAPLVLEQRISDLSVAEAIAIAFHMPFDQEMSQRLLSAAGLSASWCGGTLRRLKTRKIEDFNYRLFGKRAG